MEELILKYKALINKYQGLECNRLNIINNLNHKIANIKGEIETTKLKLNNLNNSLIETEEAENLVKKFDKYFIVGLLIGLILASLNGTLNIINLKYALINLGITFTPIIISIVCFLAKYKFIPKNKKNYSLLNKQNIKLEIKDTKKNLNKLLEEKKSYEETLEQEKSNNIYIEAVTNLEYLIVYLSQYEENPSLYIQINNELENNPHNINSLKNTVLSLRRKKNE